MRTILLLAPLAILAIGFALPTSAAYGQASTGGPDSYGYEWADDRAPGGPTLNFESYSSGTPMYLNDDDYTGSIPLGFSFDYYGTTYSNVYISSNGLVAFTSLYDSYCCQGYALPSNGPVNSISHFWTDLTPPYSGAMYYQTKGTAPNRYFLLTLYDVSYYANVAYLSQYGGVNVQLKLFEGSNNIEIHIQGAIPSYYDNVAIGIKQNASTGLQYYLGLYPPSGRAVRFSQPPSHEVRLNGATANYSSSFTEGGAPAATSAQLVIDNATSIDGATVTLTNPINGADERLAASGSGAVSVSANASNTVLTFSGNGSIADYQNALASVTYANSSDNPSSTPRLIDFVVRDGTSPSPAATCTVTVTGTNDAPDVIPPTSPPNLESGTPQILSSSAVPTVVDPDAGTGQVELRITANQGAMLRLTSQTGVTLTTAQSGTSIAFQGTLSNINNALRSLEITPANGFVGSLSLDFQVNDLGNTGQGSAQTGGAQVTYEVVPAHLLEITVEGATETEPGVWDINDLSSTGALEVGTPLTVTVRLSSVGTQPITFNSAPEIQLVSGPITVDTIGSPSSAPLPAGQSRTFGLQLTASSLGLFRLRVSTSTNDDLNPSRTMFIEGGQPGFVVPAGASNCAAAPMATPSTIAGLALLALTLLGLVGIRRRLA